jgi:hypothetical protein
LQQASALRMTQRVAQVVQPGGAPGVARTLAWFTVK